MVSQAGEIDVLVNNAGTLYCHPHDAFPEADAMEILTVNLRAPVALIEALAPQMRRRKSGRIVNVGSVAAFTGHPDLWYGATKAAILGLFRPRVPAGGSGGDDPVTWHRQPDVPERGHHRHQQRFFSALESRLRKSENRGGGARFTEIGAG
jgi:hypothetical protein